MPELDLEALQSTSLVREPFPYVIVPGFVRPEARPSIHADYPRIDSPGSFPVQELDYGPAFRAFLQTLRGDAFRTACAEKFGVDLTGRPTMITVRGHCGTRDGNIHTDTPTKILTILIYLNPRWEDAGGRLRLLRSPHDLDDVLAEVPPVEGTLVAFCRSDNSWHGHKPFIGPRRVVQLNWLTSHAVARREVLRHRMSAWVKWVGSLGGRRAAAA